jgi:hypothetical protein
MATSSSKPTGVHYALVFFVLLSIVCGVGWLLAYKGSGSIGELRAASDRDRKDKTTAETALRKSLDEMEMVKRKLGATLSEVGSDESNANTVLGHMAGMIARFAPGVAQPTYDDTLVKMSEELRNAVNERDKLEDRLKTELATFDSEKKALNGQLNAEKQARQLADQGKANADNTHSEELKKKSEDIDELRREIARTQQEYDQFKESAERNIKDLNKRVANLLTINKKVGDELEQKTRTSFEKSNGEIVWIDSISKRVWINLGEADGLRPRTTFSVYKKNHSGVGRGSRPNMTGPEDIKGAIEVTRIMGPHQAEARVLEEDLYSPIGRQDPIFTPLWSPGRGEAFSIVGIIDLDGDGKSDREMFRELVTAAGATIDNEVDDKAQLIINGKPTDPDELPRLSERTKFLVKGNIPDVGEVIGDEQTTILKILTLQKEMDQQARERGIRSVSLSDFLSFIGYKSQRRLFVPGGDAPYTLKDGSRKASAEKGSAASVSTGLTSGAYSGDTKLRVKSFEGGNVSGYRSSSGK